MPNIKQAWTERLLHWSITPVSRTSWLLGILRCRCVFYWGWWVISKDGPSSTLKSHLKTMPWPSRNGLLFLTLGSSLKSYISTYLLKALLDLLQETQYVCEGGNRCLRNWVRNSVKMWSHVEGWCRVDSAGTENEGSLRRSLAAHRV